MFNIPLGLPIRLQRFRSERQQIQRSEAPRLGLLEEKTLTSFLKRSVDRTATFWRACPLPRSRRASRSSPRRWHRTPLNATHSEHLAAAGLALEHEPRRPLCAAAITTICCVCRVRKPVDQFPTRKLCGRSGVASDEARCKACNSLAATTAAHRHRLVRMSPAQIQARIAQLTAAPDRTRLNATHSEHLAAAGLALEYEPRRPLAPRRSRRSVACAGCGSRSTVSYTRSPWSGSS